MKKIVLWAAFGVLLTSRAHGGTVLAVSLNPFGLSIFGGPYSLAFQLGGGSEAGNNTAVLSNFSFGGGAAGGTPILIGGASGSLSSGVTLTDSDAANIFIEGITFGSMLMFDLFLTTNVDTGGTPDEFLWSILDDAMNPVPTTSPSVLEPLLSVTIESASPSVSTFAAAFTSPPFPAPLVEQIEIPEPQSWLLLLAGLPALVWIWWRRQSPFPH